MQIFINNFINKYKAVWVVINSERKAKKDPHTHVHHIKKNGQQFECPEEIAKLFNEGFSSIADKKL